MAKLTLLHTPCTPTDSKASCYSNLWHPRLHVLYKYYLIGNCTVIIIVLGNIMVTTCRSSGTYFVKPYYRYTWLFYLSSDAPALSRVFYFMNSMKYINIIIDCSALFMDWQNPDRKNFIAGFWWMFLVVPLEFVHLSASMLKKNVCFSHFMIMVHLTYLPF